MDTRKQFYNIAFGIYALSEHYRATGYQSSLELAMALFDATEKYGLDPSAGGYIEACNRKWRSIDDFRLSGKDLNCPKSMNTNLHVLEAYTNLANVSENERVRKALESLLRITLDKIVNRDWHFELFFDMNWNSLTKDISYGHDIEGSWLLYEAALAVGDESLISKVKQTALAIAEVIYNAAIDRNNGGLLSGCDAAGHQHAKKEWWPQAEAVVGFYNAYELSGERKYFDAAESIWSYIQNYFVDSKHGEWFNELNIGIHRILICQKPGFGSALIIILVVVWRWLGGGGKGEFAAFPENHNFLIPENCHWNDVRNTHENVGKAIVDAMNGIERANPDTLFGVFSSFDDANWTDKNKLSDERLKDLVEHMSKIKVGNKNYSSHTR